MTVVKESERSGRGKSMDEMPECRPSLRRVDSATTTAIMMMMLGCVRGRRLGLIAAFVPFHWTRNRAPRQAMSIVNIGRMSRLRVLMTHVHNERVPDVRLRPS